MTKKKTVKVSDVNKEIVEEMVEEQKAKEIASKIPGVISDVNDGIKVVKSINDLDKSVGSLLNITSLLDKRIDMLREDYESLENRVTKIAGRMGI